MFAQEGSRTPIPFGTRPSSVHVYQFHHLGTKHNNTFNTSITQYVYFPPRKRTQGFLVGTLQPSVRFKIHYPKTISLNKQNHATTTSYLQILPANARKTIQHHAIQQTLKPKRRLFTSSLHISSL